MSTKRLSIVVAHYSNGQVVKVFTNEKETANYFFSMWRPFLSGKGEVDELIENVSNLINEKHYRTAIDTMIAATENKELWNGDIYTLKEHIHIVPEEGDQEDAPFTADELLDAIPMMSSMTVSNAFAGHPQAKHLREKWSSLFDRNLINEDAAVSFARYLTEDNRKMFYKYLREQLKPEKKEEDGISAYTFLDYVIIKNGDRFVLTDEKARAPRNHLGIYRTAEEAERAAIHCFMIARPKEFIGHVKARMRGGGRVVKGIYREWYKFKEVVEREGLQMPEGLKGSNDSNATLEYNGKPL